MQNSENPPLICKCHNRKKSQMLNISLAGRMHAMETISLASAFEMKETLIDAISMGIKCVKKDGKLFFPL